ncbi:MAG: hypothetical protein JNM69_02060 [Archangium sp.]|nr:hypothetical protein [Archangium sp.]
MAWHRLSMLPEGVLSSRTWRARHDDGREAVLREVPEGVTPTPAGYAIPGVVTLREVVEVEGRRYGVWSLVQADSLQDLVERLQDSGIPIPLGFVVRVIVDAARTLVAITPARPHGGLSDSSLLVTVDGDVLVMDFGCARPGRFTAAGAPSFVNDVFALGAVLHATLTGFGGTYADAITEGLQLPPPSQLHDECTPALDDIVSRAISRSIEQRQPDLELLADELEAVLGAQLFTKTQVQAFLSKTVQRPGPPVPDVDPGPAPGIDDVPTGQHFSPGTSETMPGLEPVRIPSGTQPGTPPADAFSAVAGPADTQPQPAIPLSTQPGIPNPALMGAPPPAATIPRASVPPMTARGSGVMSAPPPSETVPRASVPPMTARGSGVMSAPPPSDAPPMTPKASSPSRPPAPIPMETQPRIVAPPVMDTRENEVPTGPRAVPPPATNVSYAKLEWAQGQTRVPTPPLGTPAATNETDDPPAPSAEHEVPALGDDDGPPTAVKRIPVAATTGELPDVDAEEADPPAPSAEHDAPALGDDDDPPTSVKRAPTSGTAPELAGVSSREVASPSITDVKPRASGSRQLIAALLVVVAGVFAAVVWKLQAASSTPTVAKVTPIAIEEDDAGAPPPVVVVAEEDDAGEEEEDEDAGVVEEPEDAGAPVVDAGVKKPVVKKKPPKRRRRR